ncbi:MAG: LysR family transcriptional regulator [Hyphomicrobiales bacterium]|jgi:DNA-binding transcriptional LysR family regulator
MNVSTSVQPGPLLELDLLRTLVAIAETGNFSAAADRLGRTPSAVSMQVKKMEEMVGTTLFVRDSRSVSLTRDGEALLQHGRRLLALNREMMTRFVRPDLVGEVHLGAPDDVAERFLPTMLRHFAETHPGVILNVLVDGTRRLKEMVDDQTLDLAIVTVGSAMNNAEGAEVIHTEPLVWAALAGGVAVEQRPLPVSLWEEGCTWRAAALDALAKDGRDYRIAYQSAHISGQRAAILADLAIAPIARSHLNSRIVEARVPTKLPPLPACSLALAVRDNPSAPVEAAAQHVRECFESHACQAA